MPQIPFVGPAYVARSPNLSAQSCINLFPVVAEAEGAKAVKALYGTPGTRLLATLGGAGGIRGAHVPTNGGAAIVVQGGSVYRVYADWTAVLAGSIDAAEDPVSIADNGTTAVIVTGANGYTVNLATNAVAQITDPAFYGANRVAVLDGYFIFNKPFTNQWYISGIDEVTFDPLDFASAESNAEPIVAIAVNHGEVFLMKRTLTEVWVNTGGADFPFSRSSSAPIQQGCAARASIAYLDNTLFWLGCDENGQGVVRRMDGYTPLRVSTDAVEYAIASYGDISDAVGYAYQQEGHLFYVLTFPGGNATWVYDVATQLWHQRAYRDPSSGALGRHRSNCHIFFGGEHVVGDYENGNLYALDLDCYSDNGDPMPAIRSGGHIASQDYSWIAHNRLQVDMETGVGLQSGQGADPAALLDWSDDGGHTWSNQHRATIGRVGEYRARVRWNRLGRSRDRVYRLTITDPVKRVILSASLNPGS